MIEKRRGGRPSKKPTEAEFKMLYSLMTQTEMAEHYKVTVQTIRRWIREYNRKDGVNAVDRTSVN